MAKELIGDFLTQDLLFDEYIIKGKGQKDIAKEYNIGAGTVCRYLQIYGIKSDRAKFAPKNLKNLISKEELIDLYYNQRKTTIEIAEMFNCADVNIGRLMDQYGLERRDNSESQFNRSVMNPNVDVNFFRTMTPDLAYVLGLWATDGTLVGNKQNNARIELIDKDVIFWVANKIGYINKISERLSNAGVHTVYTLHFSNPEVTKIFNAYGITSHKTKTIQFPEIPDEFLPHFIRGVFDGDGGISTSNNKRFRLSIAITSASKPFIDKVKDVVSGVTGCNSSPRFQNSAYTFHMTSKNHAIKFAEWIYGPNGEYFGMERKKSKFRALGANV